MIPKDYMEDADGDLLLEGEPGDYDLKIGDATQQHQRDILLAYPGQYRLAPTVGVGIWSYLNEDTGQNMYAAINREYKKDGLQIVKINGLQITAHY